jgi:hypothetical protein
MGHLLIGTRDARPIVQPLMSPIGAQRKCRYGSLPAAIRGIPENICSSRALLRLTLSGPRHRSGGICKYQKHLQHAATRHIGRYASFPGHRARARRKASTKSGRSTHSFWHCCIGEKSTKSRRKISMKSICHFANFCSELANATVPFVLPQGPVAGQTSLLSCRKARKARIFTSDGEPSGESRPRSCGSPARGHRFPPSLQDPHRAQFQRPSSRDFSAPARRHCSTTSCRSVPASRSRSSSTSSARSASTANWCTRPTRR